MSKRIVTDNPNMTGYLDGRNAVESGGRVSRQGLVPSEQQADYADGFRRGARDWAKTNSEIEQENQEC